MQVYLVGGAVRDELLGRPVGERDWVVVGATPEQMERLGYRPVGRDFPVYLHPDTHEEYALARLERKVGPGYRGFATQFSPEVTLEQDLQRRDLTINAMARSSAGALIDPFGGQRDLNERCLRHVSSAFTEDPVRVLRVARFAARFSGLGFSIAPETCALMRRIVESGEISALVPERLWRELERALAEPRPQAALDCLQGCGALAVLMPELTWDEPARVALEAAVRVSAAASVRWAALLAGTEVQQIEQLCHRLRVPTDYRELAVLTSQLLPQAAQADPSDAEALLSLLETSDAFRRPERFGKLLLAARARVPQADALWQHLSTALASAASARLPAAQLSRLKGAEIGAALRRERIALVTGSLRTSEHAP